MKTNFCRDLWREAPSVKKGCRNFDVAALSFEDGKTKLTTQRIKKRVRRFYEEHKENFLAAFGVYQYGNRCSWRSAAYPAYVSLPASGIVWFCQKLCQNGKLVPFHRALPEAFGALDGKKTMTRRAKITVMLSMTLFMGIGFWFMDSVPVGRVILALVWLFHMIYFTKGIRTAAAGEV